MFQTKSCYNTESKDNWVCQYDVSISDQQTSTIRTLCARCNAKIVFEAQGIHSVFLKSKHETLEHV